MGLSFGCALKRTWDSTSGLPLLQYAPPPADRPSCSPLLAISGLDNHWAIALLLPCRDCLLIPPNANIGPAGVPEIRIRTKRIETNRFFNRLNGFFICEYITTFSGIYMYWYFGVCIRNSAKGLVRTPSVLVMSGDSDLSDMITEMLQMLCSIAICLGPAFAYWGLTERVDFIFWSALSLGIFFLPMALLGVVMFDSLGGLNPVLIIVSIFSSFYEYLGVVAAFYVPVGLITITFVFGAYRGGVVGELLLQFVTVYLLLVAAHILGRFFWRNEEKLYWEV